MPELWFSLSAGMLSSLHCIGMCGPIVMGCVISQKPIEISLPSGSAIVTSRAGTFVPHLLYNSGRVISYSVVGAVAGMIGAGALFSTGLQSGFSIVLGALMIVMALIQMNVFPSRIFRTNKKGFIARMINDITSSRAPEARFMIGLLTPLLPCGLLYGMAAYAASSASPLTGGIEMAAFALGAAPTLILAGVLSGMLSARIRAFGTTFAAILLIAMGVLTIGRGAGFYKGGNLFHNEKEPCCAMPPTISK